MDLKEMLMQNYRLSAADADILFESMERFTLVRRETILQEGAADRYVYFVESGVVRSYISRDGREITLWIAMENQIPLASAGLTENSTARIALDAVTDAVLWRIARSRLAALCRESVVFANFCREMLERQLDQAESYWTEYYWLDKKKQYELLLKQHPSLLQRVPLKEIAAYLNVTPQSLSRIRAADD